MIETWKNSYKLIDRQKISQFLQVNDYLHFALQECAKVIFQFFPQASISLQVENLEGTEYLTVEIIPANKNYEECRNALKELDSQWFEKIGIQYQDKLIVDIVYP